MAYRSKVHAYYRTREELAHDLAMVMNSDLHPGTKYCVFRDVAWTWTEGDGKYRGVQLWSNGALTEYEASGRKLKGLRHEHAVPMKTLYALLGEMQSRETITADSVFGLLETLNIAVIVSRDEQRLLDAKHLDTMPAAFHDQRSSSYRDPMLRFKHALTVDVVDLGSDGLEGYLNT